MEYKINCGPSYSLLTVSLNKGERIIAEGGAMAWMDSSIKTITSIRGGLGKGLKRGLLSGQSLFQNTFEAEKDNAVIGLAPGKPGQIIEIDISGEDFYIERGGWLAATEGIEITAEYQGLKGLFHEGIFIVKATGKGKLFFCSYGDAELINLDGEIRIDSGHAVAWDSTLSWRITRGGQRVRAFLFSDRIVTEYSGKGRIWVQSRSPYALSDWVYPFRRIQQKNK